jgi:hypothetical protein
MITTQGFKEYLSLVSDVLSVITIVGAFIYGLFTKYKNIIGFKINEFFGYVFRTAVILLFAIILFRLLSEVLYDSVLVMAKGNDNNQLWEKGHEIAHIFSYFISGSISLGIIWLFSTVIWSGSFKYVKHLYNSKGLKNIRDEVSTKGLVIEEALYVTIDKNTVTTNFKNVTDIAQKMVKNNSLTITSSNSLAGDPHKQVHKNLVIKYRFGSGESKTITVPEHKTVTIRIDSLNWS